MEDIFLSVVHTHYLSHEAVVGHIEVANLICDDIA